MDQEGIPCYLFRNPKQKSRNPIQYTTSHVAVKQSICAFLSVSEGIFCMPSGIKDFTQEGYAEEEWPVLILHKGFETLGSRTIQIIKGRCREAEVKSGLVCKFAFRGTITSRVFRTFF